MKNTTYIRYIIGFLIAIFISSSTYAQQAPAKNQENLILIKGATLHLGNGEVIDKGNILLKDGKIEAISSEEITHEEEITEVIEAKGKHVYPGFIAANASIGLAEVDAVRATVDVDEIGTFLPHIRSIIAYDAESKIVESMRPNGVLIAQITPRGGRITGTSSVVQLDAWNWEDAVVKEDDAIHINWPSRFVKKGAWYDPKVGYEQNKEYDKQVGELYAFFEQAKAFNQLKTKDHHLAFSAMNKVFSAEKKVFINVDAEKDIIDVLAFKKQLDLNEVVIIGGRYAAKLAKELKENKVAVLVTRVHSTPQSDDDDYDLPYKLPYLLHKEGVLVGLQNTGDMERMNTRNFPFYAGTTVAHGLTKEEALSLITLNNAKILGIDKTHGSLEVGKSATLFISEGDALDMPTNLIHKAYIEGREISLESHQTNLYQRYKAKYSE